MSITQKCGCPVWLIMIGNYYFEKMEYINSCCLIHLKLYFSNQSDQNQRFYCTIKCHSDWCLLVTLLYQLQLCLAKSSRKCCLHERILYEAAPPPTQFTLIAKQKPFSGLRSYSNNPYNFPNNITPFYMSSAQPAATDY